MPEFRFRFVKRSTGRANSGTLSAFDEAHLRELLAKNSDIGELLETAPLPVPTATERQLAYLADLGVHITRPVTIREASDLIDNAQSRRQPAEDDDRILAARYRIETTEFTSKAVIFQRILAKVLSEPVDLSKFFVYRVYRDALGSQRSIGITDPDDALIEKVAAALRSDSSAMQSLHKQAKTSTTAFRWFGDLVGRDGTLLKGDSEATAAYRAAASGLQQNGLYSRPRRESSERRPSLSKSAKKHELRENEEQSHHRWVSHDLEERTPSARETRGLAWIWGVAVLGVIAFAMW